MTVLLGIMLLVFAAIFLWIAIFLYFDEETRLHDQIENWWATVGDFNDKSVLLQHHFWCKVDEFTGSNLDKLFGPKLLSLKSFTVSICLSLASMGISVFALSRISEAYQPYLPFFFGWTVLFAWAAISRIQWIRITLSSVALLICGVFSLSVLTAPEAMILDVLINDRTEEIVQSLTSDNSELNVFRTIDPEELANLGLSESEISRVQSATDEELLEILAVTEDEKEVLVSAVHNLIVEMPGYLPVGYAGRSAIGAIMFLGLLGAVVSDVVMISATRLLLRLRSTSASWRYYAIVLTANFGVAIVFLAIPFYLGFMCRMSYRLDHVFSLIAVMNWSIVVVAMSGILACSWLLGYRVTCSLLHRSLNAIAIKSVAQQKRLCFWFSGTCFVAATQLLGWNWFALLERFLGD